MYCIFKTHFLRYVIDPYGPELYLKYFLKVHYIQYINTHTKSKKPMYHKSISPEAKIQFSTLFLSVDVLDFKNHFQYNDYISLHKW